MAYHTINERGGVRPMLGGPPNYRPNRRQDFPDLPDPLRECDSCHQHAALFGPDERLSITVARVLVEWTSFTSTR